MKILVSGATADITGSNPLPLEEQKVDGCAEERKGTKKNLVSSVTADSTGGSPLPRQTQKVSRTHTGRRDTEWGGEKEDMAEHIPWD